MDRTDPICGMRGTIPAHGKYFCSQHCVQQYAKQQGLDTGGVAASASTHKQHHQKDSRLPVIILLAILIGGALLSLLYRPAMLPFMGVVLVSLALLKLIDLQGFADAYQMYDIIGKRSRTYALTYPFIELSLGLLFLFGYSVQLAAAVLAVIMVVGIISVLLQLRTGKKIQCACMGTKIKVPLTTLTLTEDIVMLIMALMVLA